MKIIQGLIFSNIWVSLSAGVMSLGFCNYIGVKHPLLFALVVFSATLFSYNLHRYLRLKDFEKSASIRHRWLFFSKHLLLLLFLAGGVSAFSLYLFFLFDWDSFIVLSIVAILTCLYALRTRNNKPLREIPFVKIYLIAIVWVISLLIWPIIHTDQGLGQYIPVIFSFFLYLIATILPFDIRDLPYDLPEQRTIPQLIGIKWAKRIALILLSLSFLLLISSVTLKWSIFFLVLAYLGHFILILNATPKKDELYYSGWIDGWYIWFGLFWLF